MLDSKPQTAPGGDVLLATLALRMGGMGLKQVAKRVGIRHGHVSEICAAYGAYPDSVTPASNQSLVLQMWAGYSDEEIAPHGKLERLHAGWWREANPRVTPRRSQMERYYADLPKARAYSAQKAKEFFQRTKNDPRYIVKRAVRMSLHRLFRLAGKKKDERAEKLLGCSWDFFVQYIEARFQPGMTWENRGTHGWHLDHFIPLAAHDLGKIRDRKRATHYKNFRPLWAKDNRMKSDKVETQGELVGC